MKWRCCLSQVRPGRYHHPTRAARAGTPVRCRFCIHRPTMQIDSVRRFTLLSSVLISLTCYRVYDFLCKASRRAPFSKPSHYVRMRLVNGLRREGFACGFWHCSFSLLPGVIQSSVSFGASARLGSSCWRALDSSFLVLPFGNDFLLIALVSSSRGLVWIVYVMVSALGSLLGVFIVDSIIRKAGEKGLAKFVKPKRVKQLKQKMDKGVGWVICTSTLLPPPFPFTTVIMSASALQTSRAKLFGGVFAGRLVRFTIEAVLALYFGKHILRFLNSPILDYVVYSLILIAVIGSILSLLKWLRRS